MNRSHLTENEKLGIVGRESLVCCGDGLFLRAEGENGAGLPAAGGICMHEGRIP
ncbi:hypothetical protein [Xylanibacillus composti]|uniref:hypothetical protein n=1 Tax=Xylanibacillus composti TaxID=1572762 RepID=UPI001BCD804E|nr:hypothetical protein [Xylanibacillus composti]